MNETAQTPAADEPTPSINAHRAYPTPRAVQSAFADVAANGCITRRDLLQAELALRTGNDVAYPNSVEVVGQWNSSLKRSWEQRDKGHFPEEWLYALFSLPDPIPANPTWGILQDVALADVYRPLFTDEQLAHIAARRAEWLAKAG